MRVMVVICEMLTGGAEVTALELIRALHGRGCDFVVAALHAGGELRDAFLATGAAVYDGLARFRFDPLGPVRVARLARRHDVDAVVVVDVARNALFHGLLGAALARRKLPALCWCNSRPDGQSGRFVWQLKTYRALGLLSGILCTSRLQRRMLVQCGLPRSRMPLLRNGVDLGRFAGAARTTLALPAGKKIIVHVANVMPDKDFATLLAAAELLARRGSDFHLVLVGRGTDSPDMLGQLQRRGIEPFVTAAGRRDDVPGILAAADALLLSSRREVFNVATIEAMAAGLPVVVSDIPAFDEMFVHGREGLKFPPGNPAALADAVEQLLDDESLRRRLAQAARRRAERFSQAAMAHSFRRLIASVTRQRGQATFRRPPNSQ